MADDPPDETPPADRPPGGGPRRGRRPSPVATRALARAGRDDDREGLGRPLRLEGVVEEGVEAGAVVLREASGRTWLLGASRRGLVGHRVRVVGAERRGLLTTAQQGPPLAVRELEDLGPA
ncbi:hypothetical protein [uncultured Pseudokineococcus sp.]|uniref:hypothetical protein n=1 Tax=uncultured Pseudokineococcus sp. TaxID=1642928 RepID=UPI00261E2C80|nr:hypothetical protein [uncultured Pseudokineococcus sp.]